MPITRTYYKVHRVFPDPDYFYLENISGSTTSFTVGKTGTPASTDLAYSLDKVSWTDIHNGGTISNVANGAKVYFRSSTGFSLNQSNKYHFSYTTAKFNVGGHIATLINYLNVNTITDIPNYAFFNMFAENPNGNNIVHANIDFYGIKTIGAYGCCGLFSYQRNMVSIPDFSGIETLGSNSLDSAFNNCSSLMVPADLSNVTSCGNRSLYLIYNGCSLLTEAIAPNISSWVTDVTYYWLNDVASTGVVRKPAGLTIPTNNNSGIPTGWTTEDY